MERSRAGYPRRPASGDGGLVDRLRILLAVARLMAGRHQAGRTLGARRLITTIDDEEADHAR